MTREDPDLFERAKAAFDALHARDPVSERVLGVARPRALLEAERLSRWVARLDANASLALRLAACCQHVERWSIPRSTFPEGRRGYHAWRRRLAEFHAERAGSVLAALGATPELCERVRRINLKQGLGRDPEVNLMEDALCLSFLEHEAAAFAERHDTVKVSGILRKTWHKMSERARAEALALELPPELRRLLDRALAAPA